MLQMIWGWQPALYLFLGGMGSGAFAMAAVLYLTDRQHNKRIVCVSMWAAVVALIVGLLLLVSELTNPLRGMMMWQSFVNLSSWMTIGAWGLFAAAAVFGISALLATVRLMAPKGKKGPDGALQAKDAAEAPALGQRVEKPLAVLSTIGIALGVFVAAYTGILLMSAPGVPLWNTPLLPVLFLVSGFDTGVALVELVALVLAKRDALTETAHRLVALSTLVLAMVEVLVLAGFLALAAGADPSTPVGEVARQSAELLTSGILAPYFWGMVVVAGLALPIVMALAGLLWKREGAANRVVTVIGAVGVLVGGCELRFLMLAAGLHADIVMEAFKAFVL